MAQTLDREPGWALLYWDNRSLLYLRDTPQNHATIQKYRYPLLKPNIPGYDSMNPLLQDPVQPKSLVAEIERSFVPGQDPLNARLMRAYVN